ncbi:MAG: MFS transporter [Chloroflexota bacterium]
MSENIKKTNLAVILVLISAGALILIERGGNFSLGLFLIPISDHLNLGREVFSFGIALQVLLSGLGAPIFGGLADRYGPAKALAAGVALQLISQFWLVNVSSALDLVGSLSLSGFGAAGFVGITMTVVGRNVSPRNKSLFFGIVMAAGGLGQFIIVPSINALILNYGWLTALYGLLILSAFLFIFSYLISFSKINDQQTSEFKQTVREALSEALKNKNFNLLTLGFFVCGFQVTFIATHFPAYLDDEGLKSLAGWSLALIGLFNIVGTLMYGFLGDRMSKKNLLVSIYFFRSLVFLVFIFAPKNEFTVLLFAGVLGLLWLSTVPLTTGVIADIFGQSYTSMLFGITLLSHNIGSFLGSWLGGRIFDQYQTYDAMWLACVVLGLVSALIHFPISSAAIQRVKSISYRS